jgi:hypothetical protein
MAPTIEQAWALLVRIASLNAHLKAYITLRPTIDTLGLYNRFGHGDAAIKTLPI